MVAMASTQAWLNPGVKSFIHISPVSGRGSRTWPVFQCFPRPLAGRWIGGGAASCSSGDGFTHCTNIEYSLFFFFCTLCKSSIYLINPTLLCCILFLLNILLYINEYDFLRFQSICSCDSEDLQYSFPAISSSCFVVMLISYRMNQEALYASNLWDRLWRKWYWFFLWCLVEFFSGVIWVWTFPCWKIWIASFILMYEI